MLGRAAFTLVCASRVQVQTAWQEALANLFSEFERHFTKRER